MGWGGVGWGGVGWGGVGMMTLMRLASIDPANSQSWKKKTSFALWKKTLFLSCNTELHAVLQSHVFVGHRDLETA